MPTSHFIDADRHVIEPTQMWFEYLPANLHHWIPTLQEQKCQQSQKKLLPRYVINGNSMFAKWDDNAALQRAIVAKSQRHKNKFDQATHPIAQLQSMDQQHIYQAYLFPTYTPFVVANTTLPAEVSVAFAEAYNCWLKDYASYDAQRLKPVALISQLDASDLTRQLENQIASGCRQIVLRPEFLTGVSAGSAQLMAFWRKCEQANVAVAFHGGTHVHANSAGLARFDSHFALHACAHPHEMQMAFLALLEAGVLEQFPHLKFAFLEAGCAWLPGWLWRLDNICYKALPEEISDRIRLLPSEYFRRQCWISFEPDEPGLAEVIHWIGSDKLLLGTDFPHPDHLHFDYENLSHIHIDTGGKHLSSLLRDNTNRFYQGETVLKNAEPESIACK